MPIFPPPLLTQYALAAFTQFVLALSILVYLGLRPVKSRTTKLLMTMFSAVMLSIFCQLARYVYNAIHPIQLAVDLVNPNIPLLIAVSLTQLAYDFPRPSSENMRERKIVLIVSTLVILSGFGVTGYALWTLFHDGIYLVKPQMSLFLCYEGFLLWNLIVLGRRILRCSRHDRRPAWKKIAAPRHPDAKAMRALALVSLLPSLMPVLAIAQYNLLNHGIMRDFASPFSALLHLGFFWAFAYVYLNYAGETSSFQNKLIGTTWVSVLMVIGVLGFIVGDACEDAFRNNVIRLDQQMISFHPTTSGGYRIESAPKQFIEEKGRLMFSDKWATATVPLGFSFPLFGERWDYAIIHSNGEVSLVPTAASFDYNPRLPAGLLRMRETLQTRQRWRQFPKIAVLEMNPHFLKQAHIYVHAMPNHTVITWELIPARQPEVTIVMQLALRHTGDIEMTYHHVSDALRYDTNQYGDAPIAIGLYPKGPDGYVQTFSLPQDLPRVIPANGGAASMYYVEFRYYLHRQMQPLFVVVIGITLFFWVGFPLYFRRMLIRPLYDLLQGVQRVQSGQFDAPVPIQFHDEIGFVTDAFNRMVHSISQAEQRLQESNRTLEQRVAERTRDLEKAQMAAESANRAKSDFLARISHELRSPLNVMFGYEQLLQQDHALTERQRESIGAIHRSGEHLLRLTNDLLDISKIEAHKIELHVQNFPLTLFLKNLARTASLAARKKGLMLQTDFSRDLPPVISSDEHRLRQVLSDLLENAIKFTEHGTITLRVMPLNDAPLSQFAVIRFEVEDTGIGIRQEDIEHIFQPFYQVKTSNPLQEGSGLGLSISQQLLRLMESQLNVHSIPEKGTTFWFDLTCKIDTGEFFPSTSQIIFPCRIAGIIGTAHRILVVDDSQENRMFLRNLLLPLGFDVFEAANGEQALECAQQHAPDLILMDLLMPVMDGFEATRRLREQSAFGATVIIAISASASPEIQQKSMEAGCHDFLEKPIQLDALLEAIRSHLNLKWIYAPSDEAEHEPEQSPKNRPILLPSQETIKKLLVFSEQGYINDVKEVLAQLHDSGSELEPFINKIEHMAEQFQCEEISSYLKGFIQ